MQDNAIPAKFPVPWGSSAGAGYIRTVPTLSLIGVNNGFASLTDGFPPLCSIPPAAGGIPPFMQDTNGILKQITGWLQWAQAGAPVQYDAAFSNAIGGYPNGSVIAAATFGRWWMSTVDNNTSDPDTGGANWVNLALLSDPTWQYLVYAGPGSITAPSWATRLQLRAYGSGGQGGAGATASAGGGGGGGYVEGTVLGISGGGTLNYNVGNAAGLAGPSPAATLITDTASRTLIQCLPGSNGTNASGGNVGLGGAGGSATGPASPYTFSGFASVGSPGENGVQTTGSTPIVYLGGSGGGAWPAGASTFNAVVSGFPGASFGAGGGGGGPSQSGGAGAAGAIIYRFLP